MVITAMINRFVMVNHASKALHKVDNKTPSLVVRKPISAGKNPTSMDVLETTTREGVVAEADFDVMLPNNPSAGKNILLARKPFRRSRLLSWCLALKNITRALDSEHPRNSLIS